MRIAAVCGSLRSQSLNAAVLRAAVRLAPAGVTITEAPSFRELPLFDADVAGSGPLPAALEPIRDCFEAADGVLICSPEYAHGFPGGLKNLLDWQVGTGELTGKPAAVITVSTSLTAGRWAHAGLTEVLTTMGVDVVPEAGLTVGAARAKVDPATGRLAPDLVADLRRAIAALATRSSHAGPGPLLRADLA
ncbi:NADPH-dependent FMN reductase [Symbioplanes lichenis]|uniref:NADPH-dependent FMN reductase n=1 Tax=Symbioplanes lichenis TaxID=1629072 RepID=UPI002739BE4F|nr:NAD(P)H-dependent oxidoreductase [Actinoplanes lichenis]